jgi:hypothetical protein
VIDGNTLYVVAAVYFSASASVGYYLFALNITNVASTVQTIQIGGTVNGFAPSGMNSKCTSTYPHSGTITFDSNHLQRSALLLLPVGGVNTVYVAFAPYPENYNGWIFGYTFNGTSFSQTALFNSTPYGTGGGFWGSGAGPASDGTSIYTATANGTLFDPNGISPVIPVDIGDSLLKLTSNLTVADYYAPYDALNYAGTGLCKNDEDFGSGGVMLIPAPFTYNGMSVVVNADKQSNLYFANQANLGKFTSGTICASSTNNIQCITTPALHSNDLVQGYWSSPAYWFDGSHSWLYYSATMDGSALFCSGTTLCQNGFGPPGVSPEAINAYQLQSSTPGPIPSATPFAKTSTLFCDYSPTPSVSSNPQNLAGSGIVWAIEPDQNKDNQQGNNNPDCASGTNNTNLVPNAALHAFSATNLATELYTSRGVTTTINKAGGFVSPTVFNGQVYVGADSQVEVFGLCPPPPGHCQP